MNFDPAIAAQNAFQRAQLSGELGDDLEAVCDAEARFSSSAGPEASAAYEELQAIGARRPEAEAFQAFLIYITWQQVTEETIPRHFVRGGELCDRYLARHGRSDTSEGQRVAALRASFRAGLGLETDEDDDYDRDVFKGGD
jgi:hypothetical protein